MEQFLKELNPAQYEAVVNITGPSLIIAGAGSGKTRVLTYRVAYLLNQGAKGGRDPVSYLYKQGSPGNEGTHRPGGG